MGGITGVAVEPSGICCWPRFYCSSRGRVRYGGSGGGGGHGSYGAHEVSKNSGRGLRSDGLFRAADYQFVAALESSSWHVH